jgi:hypothetical protein
MATRKRNTVLDSLMRETGCPREAIAARINALGAPRLRLTYGRAALSQWVAGHLPPPEVRELVAQVLAAKLGRDVTAAQIWPETLAEQSLTFPAAPAESVRLLDGLAEGDVDRRDLMIAAGYHASAFVLPAWAWLVGPDDELADTSGSRRVGVADVRRLHSALARFDLIDHARGGGQGRLVIACYLRRRVIPLLDGRYSELVGRDLFAAAALVARKAGLMAADDGLPGLAQRYGIQALRLAKASSDRAIGAHILTTISRQAIDLEQPRVAVELARAAELGTKGSAPPALRTKIAIVQARALARQFERQGHDDACRNAALAHIDTATETFAGQTETGDRRWLSNMTASYLDAQVAHTHLDLADTESATRHAAAALRGHSDHHIRRRVMGGILLATAHAAAGEPERACEVAEAALSLVNGLRSTRVRHELRRLRATLHRHRRDPEVARFLDQTRGATGDP